MDAAQKRQALNFPKPAVAWRGEPQLGGWYTEEEIEAAVAAMNPRRSSSVPYSGSMRL